MFLFLSTLSVIRLFLLVPSPPKTPDNPCVPTPCGPNSQCRVVGSQPACSCLQNFIGRPPNCRPECISDSECPNHLACLNEKCSSPCPGLCGINAQCTVVNHKPICSCFPGYTGDPSASCNLPPPPRKNYFYTIFIYFQPLKLLSANHNSSHFIQTIYYT